MISGEAVAIVGGGSWGTALAIHLARLGARPRLWARSPELVQLIRSRGENPWYLPGIPLSPGIIATHSMEEAVAGASLVILAVPSHVFRQVLAAAAPSLLPGGALLSATKGLDPDGPRRMSELIAEIAPRSQGAALSGPTFAREVAMGLPTAAVVAGAAGVAERLQQSLSSREFRLYTNRDVLGVEVSGALKNVIAIATGLSDGLGLGENARAALITRGLAEITRLGVALGASPLTFAGLAGVGDLVLTSTGSLSRNRSVGLAVGRGTPLEETLSGTRMVAEGVRTAASALALARLAGVTLPICQEVDAVLSGRKSPKEALASLLAREVRPEEEQFQSTGERPVPAPSARS